MEVLYQRQQGTNIEGFGHLDDTQVCGAQGVAGAESQRER